VYEARHQRLDKPVALKTLHPCAATDVIARERFVREGRLAARLNHPHIVDVSDFALDGDTPYLVMELLRGENLAALIARDGRLSVTRTVDLLLPIVSALTFAHDHGIVHRDLKPQNVFLHWTPTGTVSPKVVDFGISKLVDEPSHHFTRSEVILGTPHYMSPEQALGAAHIDHLSDQFSLGVIAYECLSGVRPFEGGSMLEVLNAVVLLQPAPLEAICIELPKPLAAVIATMMAKTPTDRFTCMRDVGIALLPFAGSRTRLLFEDAFASAGHADSHPSLWLGSTVFSNTVPCPQRRYWSTHSRWKWAVSGAAILTCLVGGSLLLNHPRAPFSRAAALTKLEAPLQLRPVERDPTRAADQSENELNRPSVVVRPLDVLALPQNRAEKTENSVPLAAATFRTLPNDKHTMKHPADRSISAWRSRGRDAWAQVPQPHNSTHSQLVASQTQESVEPRRGSNGAPIIP
jgi:serine/threonine-protein kinase